MYCPVDGTEYRPGFTRCPDHDVDLVPDPPIDTDEEVAILAARINARYLMKAVFLITVVAGCIYAVAGVTAVVFVIVGNYETQIPSNLQQVVIAAGRVALAGLGVLGGTVLLQTYNRQEVDVADETEVLDNEDVLTVSSTRAGSFLMRLLFALFAMFALVWTVTEVMVSRERSEYNIGLYSTEREEPPESFITLLAVNGVAYSFALTTLGTMSAVVLVDIHRRSP